MGRSTNIQTFGGNNNCYDLIIATIDENIIGAPKMLNIFFHCKIIKFF